MKTVCPIPAPQTNSMPSLFIMLPSFSWEDEQVLGLSDNGGIWDPPLEFDDEYNIHEYIEKEGFIYDRDLPGICAQHVFLNFAALLQHSQEPDGNQIDVVEICGGPGGVLRATISRGLAGGRRLA